MSTDNPSGRKALGRGLAALLPTTSANDPSPNPKAAALRMLAIEKLKPNPNQPRKIFDASGIKELADSIREQGVIQPILVRNQGTGYEIVAGERRWRAAAKAGLHEVPCVVKDLSDVDTLQVAIIENIQRRDLDPLEEAEAYHRLIIEHGLTQDAVAVAVGKSRVAVTNSLRLLKLPPEIIEMLGQAKLTAGHARALMALDEERDMLGLAKVVVNHRLSVRDTEQRARQIKTSAQKIAKKSVDKKSAATVSVEERLQRKLQAKVRLQHRHGKGKLELHFESAEQLQGLLDKLLV